MALLVLGAGTVAGCGIRLEDDSRRLPGTGAHPSVAELSAELARCRRCQTMAQRCTDPRARPLPALHARQVTVLTARLQQLGAAAPAASSSPAGTAATSPTAAPDRVSVPALLAAESDGLGAPGWTALAAVPVSDLALIGSLQVQRYLAVAALGGPNTRWPPDAVASEPERARLLAAYRSAEYGLQVAAAQAGPAQAARVRQALGQVVARRRWLESAVGPSAGPAPTDDRSGPQTGSEVLAEASYRLPFPVRTPAEATRLAVYLQQRLGTAVMAGLPAAASRPDAIATGLGWTVTALSHAQALGARAQAFPGLSTG